MSTRAGQILHLSGDSVLIDRLQSAGLGDINIPSDIIRETGNYLNVDKVLQDPDLSFSLESFDVSTEVEALVSGDTTGGSADPAGTEYPFSDFGAAHFVSPWKDAATGSAGTIDSGVVIPNYFCTRASYRFGVDENAGETFELGGSEVYMALHEPKNEVFTANGTASAFTTAGSAVRHRVGGYQSTDYKYVLGVIVDGDVQAEGTSVDFVASTPGTTAAEVATVTFNVVPASGALIQVAYFNANSFPSFPNSVHPDTSVKPAAVRGRDIKVYLHVPSGGSEASGAIELHCVQSVTVEGTKTTELERCMGELLPVGRTVTQQDANGDLVIHPSDNPALFTFLRQITGVDSAEAIGVINNFACGLEVKILNPDDRSVTLKTIWVSDAKFQIPATPARAGEIVDFTMRYESQQGDFSIFKGDM